MDQLKTWWQSKTVWSGLATTAISLLGGLDWSHMATAVLGIATVVFRTMASKAINWLNANVPPLK